MVRVWRDRVEERRAEFEETREFLGVEPRRLRRRTTQELEIRCEETLEEKRWGQPFFRQSSREKGKAHFVDEFREEHQWKDVGDASLYEAGQLKVFERKRHSSNSR